MTGPRLPLDHPLIQAVFGDVPHDITAERIVIAHDSSKPGNALAQLHVRLARYLIERDRTPATHGPDWSDE